MPKCATELERQPSGDRARPTCPACGFIFYFNPVVGAAALVETEGRVVLVRRGVEPKAGYWSLPSGYVEADELTEAAAIRETQEETGPEIEIEDLLGVYSFGREPPTGVLILYSAHTVGGALRAGDDTCDVQAFAPANSRKTTKSPFEPICRRCTIGAEGEPSCTVRRFRPSGRPLLN